MPNKLDHAQAKHQRLTDIRKKMLDNKITFRAIAKNCNISYGTVNRIIKEVPEQDLDIIEKSIDIILNQNN